MLIITDLPKLMAQTEHWPVASACMNRWFAGKARTMSLDVKTAKDSMDTLPPEMLEEALLTMEWALGFQRVKMAYDILTTQTWKNPAALRQMAVRIRAQVGEGAAQGVKQGTPWRFGDLMRKTKSVDHVSQVNFIPVGDIRDPLDDFYGAVGKGSLNVAVAGDVTNLADGGLTILVDTLGVYLRDTYDFIGVEKLGVWSENGIDRSEINEVANLYLSIFPSIAIESPGPASAGKDDPDKRYSVANEDFCRYRVKSARGGDFVDVSDVRLIKLPIKQRFEFR